MSLYSNGKLNLKSIGSNMTELEVGNTSILFSYQTPVAKLIKVILKVLSIKG